MAVAKKTAGKYGVKYTSGRSIARIHRAAVDRARQVIENPMLNASEGREIPCQTCRNSSINPARGRITGYSESESRVTLAEIGRTQPAGGELSPSTLELRFRSSHGIAATSDASFGIKGALVTY